VTALRRRSWCAECASARASSDASFSAISALFTCGSARRICYAAHVDRVPAITLASLNALSYLALHRSRLGELVGHLCTVEMTS